MRAASTSRSARRPRSPARRNIEALGELLYTRYLFLFEAAGLILLVAMIGAIVLTHRSRGGVRAQNVSKQSRAPAAGCDRGNDASRASGRG